MTVTSPQAANAALCQQTAVTYDILLENPEPTAISGLALTLVPTDGVTFVNVEGAVQDSLNGWKFNVPDMSAGVSGYVSITVNMPANLAGINGVATTITLSAGSTILTPESNATTTVTQRVDGLPPTVSIDAPNGAAVAAAGHTFIGTASDIGTDGLDGSGVTTVEVSWDGTTWFAAEGTLAWSIPLDPPAANPNLHVRAADSCGNTSSTVTQLFNVDSTPPEVTWTAPVVVTEALAEVSITALDTPSGSQVRSVEVQLDNETNAWQPALNTADAWIWNWVTPREDGISHTLRVRATDAVGNTTTTGWQPTIVDNVGTTAHGEPDCDRAPGH